MDHIRHGSAARSIKGNTALVLPLLCRSTTTSVRLTAAPTQTAKLTGASGVATYGGYTVRIYAIDAVSDVHDAPQQLPQQHEPQQTEGVTGSHRNWQRGETREGAALKETTKHTGKGNSKGPTREQRGQLPPRLKQATATPLQGGAAQERSGASNTKQQGNQPPVKGAASLRLKATPKGSQAKTGS